MELELDRIDPKRRIGSCPGIGVLLDSSIWGGSVVEWTRSEAMTSPPQAAVCGGGDAMASSSSPFLASHPDPDRLSIMTEASRLNFQVFP